MVALTVFAAVFTTIKELKEHPSELMRPKAPAAGKRILLDHWHNYRYHISLLNPRSAMAAAPSNPLSW